MKRTGKKAVSVSEIPHLRKTGTATQLIVDGRPWVMLGGEVHNSSASNLQYMDPIWDRLAALNLNTVLVPVSWELVELEEDRFDFSLVDGLIQGARRHNFRLVPLWFGTWKNAMSTYAPAWVKTDGKRFPRVQCLPGKNIRALSCLSEEACAADARAFGALMRHIREVDGREHTVLMVQVENETGILGGTRDRSPLAEAHFAKPVPRELTSYLKQHADALVPEFRRIWDAAGQRSSGAWTEVFGGAADEVFMAWHVARYVDAVAVAGKAEYPLPMYANAWLVGHEGQWAGGYPSGGPIAKMMNVWQAAAPHIDMLAPDIYRSDFRAACAEFTQCGNPLMIPEAIRDARAAANVFYAVAQHDAICFAPFAIEDNRVPHPMAASYRLLADLMPIITKYHGTGRMVGLVQEGPGGREFELGGYRLHVQYSKPLQDGAPPGRGLIIAISDDEYLVAGAGFTVDLAPKAGQTHNVEILAVEEGRFQAGKWTPERRLNGDETTHSTQLCLHGEEPTVLMAKMFHYA